MNPFFSINQIKKMKRISFILVITSVFLFSCEKEIEFKGEGKQPLLVLDAILENHQTPMVTVSRSAFFLTKNTEPSIKELSGATVVLTNLDLNESYVLQNISATGKYFGSVPIEPNTNYKIEVSYPNFKTISSQLKTVSDIELTSIDTSSVFIQNPYGTPSNVGQVLFNFQDTPGESYYALTSMPYIQKDVYDEDSVFQYSTTGYFNSYNFTNESTIQFGYGGYYFINDLLYQNKPINLTLNTYLTEGYVYDGSGNYYTEKVLKWKGILKSMTKDMYLYFKTSQNNQGGSPFSDPSNVHTNIKDGLGIFGSVSVDEKEK